MDTKRDPAAARTAVTRLLKRYYETLSTRLAAGTAEVWGRIEHRLAQTSTSDSERPRGMMQPPDRQQPVQQQQAKTELDEKK
ncbi:MAG TPA: hypothetical protein VJT13_17805 [Xanthobacteraceae bacterium]|nr:hypothetical protein [Xanthobacteraceae bacterium]